MGERIVDIHPGIEACDAEVIQLYVGLDHNIGSLTSSKASDIVLHDARGISLLG